MRIRKIFISVFFLTFMIGIGSFFIVQPTNKLFMSTGIVKEVPKAVLPPLTETKLESEIIEENNDWQNVDDSKFKIKLLETGQGFHGDEIEAKSGETWLGLFKEKNKYFLRSIKIKVRRSHDVVVDEPRAKTGKDVTVNGKNQPIFLLKNAVTLKEGEIKTIFYNPSNENLTNLGNGFVANYEINNKKYKLSVEGGANSSNLILGTDKTKQILFSVDKMGDATWNLIWVGDLDGDRKLDIYADLPVFYNFSQRRLFLSSQAENGKLIKQVALFHTSGC